MDNKRIIFLSVIMLMLFGCAANSSNQSQMSMQQIDNNRRQNYVSSHPSLPEEIKQNILNGVIQIGMTKEMVMATLGEPNNVQGSGDASGIREVLVYYTPLPEPDASSLAGLSPADITLAYSIALSRRKATYLFFIDGVFTSFREQ
jgi:hypothetical protein